MLESNKEEEERGWGVRGVDPGKRALATAVSHLLARKSVP